MPQESYFVVFEKSTDSKGDANAKSNDLNLAPIATLDGAWTVSFNSGEVARGPKDAVKFDSLIDWSTSDNDAIKYYSGAATYATTFKLEKKPEGRAYMTLGDVAEMAKVKINGKYVGGVWTFPYRLDVTDALQEGENAVEIEVVNCWVNRLIGDAKLPEAERKTWCPVNDYTPNSPLKKSGLIGPVAISVAK